LEGTVSAQALAVSLADLHALILRLPDVFPEGAEDGTTVDNAASSTSPPLPELPFDYYYVVFQPLTLEPEQPVAASLADDLDDIRADLRRGLRLFDAGRAEAACWEWRLSFRSHWGAHLTNAQRALYCHLCT
jgi:hypothetical protein